MRSWFIVVGLVVVCSIVEVVVPGLVQYRNDLFNVTVALLVILILAFARREPALPQVQTAMLAATMLCAVAVVANGLFAPSPRTVAGAPGATIPIAAFGASAHFPLTDAATRTVAVTGLGPVFHFGNDRYAMTAHVSEMLRRVVMVSASDPVHGHLTVTQPNGSSFLSPILLMRSEQVIDGERVPYDGFTVPAIHRNVKVILFSPTQAATLRRFDSRGMSGLLFVLTNDAGDTLTNGIALARDDELVTVDGVQLRGRVIAFPDVTLAAIPFLPAVILGMLAFFIGCGVGWRSR